MLSMCCTVYTYCTLECKHIEAFLVAARILQKAALKGTKRNKSGVTQQSDTAQMHLSPLRKGCQNELTFDWILLMYAGN